MANSRFPSFALVALAALAAAWLATACSSGGGPTDPPSSTLPPGPNRFAISTTTLSFGSAETERALMIENRGTATVSWSAETSAAWLTVTPAGGSLPVGETAVRVGVQRALLPAGALSGRVELHIDQVPFTVGVVVENPGPPQVRITPASVALGPDEASARVTVAHAGGTPLSWTLTGPAWITISPRQGTFGVGGSLSVTLTADRSGLSDGVHQGSVEMAWEGASEALPVSVEVASPAELAVAPAAIDFGTGSTERTLTLSNGGGRPLSWSAAPDAAWLAVSDRSGTIGPHASASLTVTASRDGLAEGGHAATLRVTSGAGQGNVRATIEIAGSSPPPSAPPPPPPPPPPTSIALQGRIVDQFTGSGMSGLTVAFAGATAVTDATGQFAVPGQPSSSLRSLELSGASIHRRRTFARTGGSSWEAIPTGFSMSAFDDLAREYEPRTIRWTSPPSVYIDVTAHGFTDGSTTVPGAWVSEIQGAVAARMSQWSDGAINPASVTVGTAPPPEGTPGTLVIEFDEDPGRYTSSRTVGLARTYWSGNRAISSARIWLRFAAIGDATTRLAIFAHELGHSMGMGHMNGSTASIMTPVVSSAGLTPFDLDAGEIVYSRSPGNTSPDSDDANTFTGQLAPAARAVGSYHWVCGDPAP